MRETGYYNEFIATGEGEYTIVGSQQKQNRNFLNKVMWPWSCPPVAIALEKLGLLTEVELQRSSLTVIYYFLLFGFHNIEQIKSGWFFAGFVWHYFKSSENV